MTRLHFRGPVLTASGYGVHARQILDALMEAGQYDIYADQIPWGQCSWLPVTDHAFSRYANACGKMENLKSQVAEDQFNAVFDVSVQVTIPNEFARRAKFNIGVTAGIETDRIAPEWIPQCNLMDLIVVPSEHSKNVMEQTRYEVYDHKAGKEHEIQITTPIVIVEESVKIDTFFPGAQAESITDELFSTDFNFLVVGQWGVNVNFGQDRKNITNTIKAFYEEFHNDEDVGLVLKIAAIRNSIPDRFIVQARLAELKELLVKEITQQVGHEPKCKLYLVSGFATDKELAALYNHPKIKAFVSLTHGEGYGLPIIEAAACGLPVIATNWSGHLTFLGEAKRRWLPVPVTPVPVPASFVWQGVIPEGVMWAEPSLDDAKIIMRRFYSKASTPTAWAKKLSKEIAENYNPGVLGRKFVDLVQASAHEFFQKNSVEYWVANNILPGDKHKILYTMPQSAGDIFLSTGVIDNLISDTGLAADAVEAYIATKPVFKGVVKDLGYNWIEFQPWMHTPDLTNKIWDEVYTPDLFVQYQGSNWVNRRNKRHLAEEFAAHCGLEPGPLLPRIVTDPLEGFSNASPYVVIHPGYKKGHARHYAYWQDVIDNLRSNGVRVVQIGGPDDPEYRSVEDLRGKTTFTEAAGIIGDATAFVGIDSFPMHVANHLDVPGVALFGSSNPECTGKLIHTEYGSDRLTIIEAVDRKGCAAPCYKDQCVVDKDNPCINNIAAATVYNNVMDIWEPAVSLDVQPDDRVLAVLRKPFEEQFPSISGYTTTFNALKYPFEQSITSMLGFCDEVVVVDGISTDGTWEKLQEAFGNDDRVQLYQKEWDFNEPGIDGQQKAFARALCTGDYLWQMDGDEIVHENDYLKIKKLTKTFSSDFGVLALPVVELWGDTKHLRGDRHLWKWRLSKNDPLITHGINAGARRQAPDGRIYAATGMSDGCEYVNSYTYQSTPTQNFWTADIERLRLTDPIAYESVVQRIIEDMPCVWHYSWADIPAKVKQFRDMWDKQWSCLYLEQEQGKKRFFKDKDWNDVTDEEIAELANTIFRVGHEFAGIGEEVVYPKYDLERMGFKQPEIMTGTKYSRLSR